jgi:hypothetical protein
VLLDAVVALVLVSVLLCGVARLSTVLSRELGELERRIEAALDAHESAERRTVELTERR